MSAKAMAEGGVPIRLVQAFDHTNGQHISLVNTYGGTAPMNANVEDTQKNFVVRVVARPTPLGASTPDGPGGPQLHAGWAGTPRWAATTARP